MYIQAKTITINKANKISIYHIGRGKFLITITEKERVDFYGNQKRKKHRRQANSEENFYDNCFSNKN